MVKDYYRLTKPGIIYGNALSAVAGFLFASARHIDPLTLIYMVLGLSLVIASACVCNNYLDRGIDNQMSRTKRRALVTGLIKPRQALVFAAVLLVAGVLLLAFGTTSVALLAALFGFMAYVALYGYAKRTTVHGTIIGSISGAVPPVVGYTAVTGQIDSTALLLFAVLVFWQMPHFYAIALFRAKDYAKAHIPVLPLVYGERTTRWSIQLYIIWFTISAVCIAVFAHAGWVYGIGMTVVGIGWLAKGWLRWRAPTIPWARMMFGTSLLALLAWCVLLSFSPWLP